MKYKTKIKKDKKCFLNNSFLNLKIFKFKIKKIQLNMNLQIHKERVLHQKLSDLDQKYSIWNHYEF